MAEPTPTQDTAGSVRNPRWGGLLRTKSVEQSIRDTDEPDSKLRKDLTAWDLTVFGVAVVVGAGIFTLTARTAGNVAGPSVSLAFVFAAVACGLTALCYAEFASTVPVAGSAYTFSYATFGELAAWIIGWDLILEFALAASVVAKGSSAAVTTGGPPASGVWRVPRGYPGMSRAKVLSTFDRNPTSGRCDRRRRRTDCRTWQTCGDSTAPEERTARRASAGRALALGLSTRKSQRGERLRSPDNGSDDRPGSSARSSHTGGAVGEPVAKGDVCPISARPAGVARSRRRNFPRETKGL
ncbi:amino acid permease [Micromonospora sp. NPDC048843]|uniref:amino acid permease n=1 Tax=Micromonospora sp. NPDC048843 TaxID=3155389 RepID=UPI0033E2C8C2